MKLFVHEYPKSGGSWLVSLLGDALGLPKRDLYVTDGFGLFDIWKHPWYRGAAGLELTVDCVVKSHEPPGSELVRPFAQESEHLCLVRDGRDVVVSKYFFERDFCVRNGITAGFDIPFDDYVRRTAPEWSAHVQNWLVAGVPICRYQDFLDDPVAALRAACASVHRHEVGEAELRAAVAANTPERMRRSLDDAFAHNIFVRAARAGDWRNHFSPANERDFLDAAGDTLARLGYAS